MGPLSAIADVNGMFFDRQRSFLYRFAQGWMRVHRSSEIFAAPAKFHHRDDLGD